MNATISLGEDEPPNAKETLRRHMRAVRGALAVEQQTAAAHRACAALLALPELTSARAVAVYAAVRGEIDPSAAARALVERGVRVVYPRVASARALSFHDVIDPAELARAAFGLREPTSAHPEIGLADIDVFVVPGLAFDARGHRLGWGRGYYDSTLALSRGVRVALAYHCQVVSEVPVGASDQPVDILVTEAGAVRTRAGLARSPSTNQPITALPQEPV